MIHVADGDHFVEAGANYDTVFTGYGENVIKNDEREVTSWKQSTECHDAFFAQRATV